MGNKGKRPGSSKKKMREKMMLARAMRGLGNKPIPESLKQKLEARKREAEKSKASTSKQPPGTPIGAQTVKPPSTPNPSHKLNQSSKTAIRRPVTVAEDQKLSASPDPPSNPSVILKHQHGLAPQDSQDGNASLISTLSDADFNHLVNFIKKEKCCGCSRTNSLIQLHGNSNNSGISQELLDRLSNAISY